MPTRGLAQWQVGTETTWGTAVTMTAKLMGVQEKSYLQAANKSDIYPDIRNSLAPSYLAGLEQTAGGGKLEMIATFEDVAYVFDNVFGQAAPSGAGPYVRAYTAPLSTAVTPRILTCTHGNTQTGGGIYKLAGGLLNTMNIKGATGKPTTIEAELIGKSVASGAFAALSDRTVEVIMGMPWLIYMDAVGGTIGTTQLATTAVAFELETKLNRVLAWSMDALPPDSWEQNPWEGTLKLTLRMNTTTETEIDAIVAQTAVYQKQVRLKTTSGTKILQLDFAGTMKEPPKTYDDKDGILTIGMELAGTYNTAMGNWLAASVTNSVATLA